MLVPSLSADTTAACTFGLRLGLHCVYSCASLTMVLLAVGVMDLYAMAAVTAAITIERLVPAGARRARMIGIAIIALGLFLMAGAAIRSIAP
jgi:predicted metal-binding membrane protein